jgi:hypothetical protein
MQYSCGGHTKETFLNLGVATIEIGAENHFPLTQDKHRVGLQYCKVGSQRTVHLDWQEGTGIDSDGDPTGTARIQFKVRARRIRQNKTSWEFKDDAGSGIRGKSHDSSAFRFWGCLERSDLHVAESKSVDDIIKIAQEESSGAYMHREVRVWSKGNCPGRTRKGGDKNSTHPHSNSAAGEQKQAAPSLAGPVASTAPNPPTYVKEEPYVKEELVAASMPMQFIPVALPVMTMMSAPAFASTHNNPGSAHASTDHVAAGGMKRKAPEQPTHNKSSNAISLAPPQMTVKRIKSESKCGILHIAAEEQDNNELAELDYIINCLTPKVEETSSETDDVWSNDGSASTGDDGMLASLGWGRTCWSPLAFEVESLS